MYGCTGVSLICCSPVLVNMIGLIYKKYFLIIIRFSQLKNFPCNSAFLSLILCPKNDNYKDNDNYISMCAEVMSSGALNAQAL